MNNRQIRICVEQLGHKQEPVRRVAAKQLTKIGTPAIPALISALKSDDACVSAHAARVLGKIGDLATVPALVDALKSDELDVRLACADSLGEIGDAAAVPALIEALKDEDADVFFFVGSERTDITACVTAALVKIGAASTLATIEALDDADERVRGVAASVLRQLGDSYKLACKILAESRLSAQERIDALEALFRAYAVGKLGPHRPVCRDVATLCHIVLTREPADAQRGAQTVLNWLNGERDLLHASERNRALDGEELLRAAQLGVTKTDLDTLLSPSVVPPNGD
jgi:hypothetical protein